VSEPCVGTTQNEPDVTHAAQSGRDVGDRGQGDLSGALYRIEEGPRRNRRKRDRAAAVRLGEAQRVAVARREDGRGGRVVAIDGPKTMDNVPVWQSVRARDHGFAGGNRRDLWVRFFNIVNESTRPESEIFADHRSSCARGANGLSALFEVLSADANRGRASQAANHHFSAKLKSLRACFKFGASINLPFSSIAPASGFASKALTTARAWSRASWVGVKAELMTPIWAG